MDSTLTALTREIVLQRIRARRAEEEQQLLERLLSALGVTVWHTDRRLQILGTYGRHAPGSRRERGVEEFCRSAWGAGSGDAEPLAAHDDAVLGRTVTLELDHGARRVAMILEPKRGSGSVITGVVAMAIELAETSRT